MANRILAFLLIIILAPLLMLVAAIIIWDDRLPILFKQKRVGLNNSSFYVYKFRTMSRDMPDIPTHLVESQDCIYTKSGPLLRKLSIDELPQLINIILGDMVFVGPRPALHNQTDLIELRTTVGVHYLTPGVTGWAQINGRDELSIPEKVHYDQYYLHNRSLLMDIRIILLTIYRVASMQGVSQ
jgi:O-antigen biosynthesis protein WbqP